jgi:hypothetical protein
MNRELNRVMLKGDQSQKLKIELTMVLGDKNGEFH